MSKWTNPDGLHVRFGLAEGEYTKQTVASVCPWQTVIAGLKVGENISTTSATQLAGGRLDAEHPFIIPKGSIFRNAFFIVDVAFDSGGSATLDLGLSIAAGTYAGGDENGFGAAITEASIDTAGKIVDLYQESTFKGAYLSNDGTYAVTSVDLYPSLDVDTAAFTVGEGRLIFDFLPPMGLGPTTYGGPNN